MSNNSNYIVNFAANYSRGTGEDNKGDRQDYKSRFTCKPNCSSTNGGPPYFSVTIFILCWVAYFTYNLGDDPNVALIKSPFIYRAKECYYFKDTWRYFTYSFLHADLAHILSNMIIFMLVTPLLELAHDSLRPMLVYFVGVFLGAVLSGIWSPGNYLVGASGGCYAVVLAHIANILLNCREMDKKWLTARLVVLAPLVIMAGFDIWRAIDRYSGDFYGGGGVSYAAHVGGTITGLLFGVVVLRNYTKENWEKYMRWVFLILYFGFFAYAIVMTIMSWPSSEDASGDAKGLTGENSPDYGQESD